MLTPNICRCWLYWFSSFGADSKPGLDASSKIISLYFPFFFKKKFTVQLFWLFCIKFTVTMLWTAISKKRVKLKEAVISQALPLSVKLPLVSLFGLGHSLTSSFCELNILLISKFSFLDDWFIAVASTSCVYPASPRYIFLVLTSNNKSLSFWVYILVFFFHERKNFQLLFSNEKLSLLWSESGLKFVENFVFVYVGT